MLYLALILFVYAFHNQLDKHRTLAAEAFKIDFLRVVGTVHCLAVVDEVGHLDVQQQRFLGEFHVKGEKAAVIGDDREVCLRLERLGGGFDAQHVFRSVGESGHDVLPSEVHIYNLRREDNVRGLLIAYLQRVGRYHSVKSDLAGKTAELVAVGVVLTVHVYVVFSDRLSVRRHMVICVFDRLCVFGKRRGCHAYYGNDREDDISCLHICLVVVVIHLRAGGASHGIRL